MALILATAFLAIAALALPDPTSLLARDFPPVVGFDTGSLFKDLTFTIYSEADCNDEAAGTYTGSYGLYEAYQMQSYHLSRALNGTENLDFYAGSGTDMQVNNTIDHTLDGHYTEACWVYDATAGLNATTHDKAAEHGEHHGRDEGCHTLDKNEWCAMIWKA